MANATRFIQPIDYYGEYKTNSWAGYYFKELLGYTSGRHTGVDYNGAGAGNADLGMHIRSIANGKVVYTGDHSGIGFGNVIFVQYILTEKLRNELGCNTLIGRHMHVQNTNVRAGQEVNIGDVIGTVGNSGTTWAHLHLDLYKDTISHGAVHFNYDKDTQLASYLDPYEFINAHAADEAPALAPNQRVVGPSGNNYRVAPSTDAAIIKEFVQGEILDFKGYVRGQTVGGSNIWFVGAYTGGYSHSLSFTQPDTNGLPDLTPANPTPVPPPTTPTPEPAYSFTKDLACVTQVVPAGLRSFEYGNFPLNPQKAVIHDFGRDGVDTFESTLNWFKKPDNVAAQFVVSGKRIVQMVALKDRAYHAGPIGNVYVGIETDPKQDPDTIASTKTLLTQLRDKYGYKLETIEHNSIMNTLCGDDVDLKNYEIDPLPEPPTTPTPVPPPPVPIPPVDLDKENNTLLKQILALLQGLVDSFKSIFK